MSSRVAMRYLPAVQGRFNERTAIARSRSHRDSRGPAHFLGSAPGIASEWTLTALTASVLAFYASARALQLGPGVAVIAFTSVAANLAAIMGGILVFRDPIGIGAPPIVGRVVAFGLVIAGVALM